MRKGSLPAAAARTRSRQAPIRSLIRSAFRSLLLSLHHRSIEASDMLGLAHRVREPFLHRRQRDQMPLIRRTVFCERDAIALEPECDRAIERVDNAKRAAKIIAASTEALPALAPNLADAFDFGCDRGGRNAWLGDPQIH